MFLITLGDKIPGKGTLKRKRWFIEQLQQKNNNYEDDLFEDKKFGHFQNLLEVFLINLFKT